MPAAVKKRSAKLDRENELRLVAADVIHRLWKARNVSQLNLLKMQCDSSIGALRGGPAPKERLFALCRELDIEMDGVRCPASAAAILIAIRSVIRKAENE